jgi:hypothetical protein
MATLNVQNLLMVEHPNCGYNYLLWERLLWDGYYDGYYLQYNAPGVHVSMASNQFHNFGAPTAKNRLQRTFKAMNTPL